MKLLSSLSEQEKNQLLAELDGEFDLWQECLGIAQKQVCASSIFPHAVTLFGKNYIASYDAIIALIQKQSADTDYRLLKELNKMCWWDYTPLQLADALLLATGKVTVE